MALDPRLSPVVEALRDLLAERRLSQAEVERRAGFPKRYLTRLFGGEVRLLVAHVYDMLEAANIEPREFYLRLAGIGPQTTPDIEGRLAANEAAIRQLEAAVLRRPSNGSPDS